MPLLLLYEGRLELCFTAIRRRGHVPDHSNDTRNRRCTMVRVLYWQLEGLPPLREIKAEDGLVDEALGKVEVLPHGEEHRHRRSSECKMEEGADLVAVASRLVSFKIDPSPEEGDVSVRATP